MTCGCAWLFHCTVPPLGTMSEPSLGLSQRALPMFDAQYLLVMVHESMKFVFFNEMLNKFKNLLIYLD